VTVKHVGVRGGVTINVRGGFNCKIVRSEGRCHGKGCRKCLGNYVPQIGRCLERCCQQQEVLREQVAQATHMAGTLDFAVAELIQVPVAFSPFSFSCLLPSFLFRCVCACGRGYMCVSTCAQYITHTHTHTHTHGVR
jgi:hypothetical protein